MSKEMLISTVEGLESRIAIVDDGVLEELYVERASSASHVGNIYKGRVTNIEPAIQAAFVDFGLGKNGFLHISDVHPQYFPYGQKDDEHVGRKRGHKDRPLIQDCLRRGQEVVIQLTKEGIGTKGPTLTSYLSIPGRLLVMMPRMSRLGVSRKVEDEQARAKAREMLADLRLPADMGFIIRTAGVDSNKKEIRRDLNYLMRLWKAVKQRINTSKAPAEIYQESNLVIRTIRDVYNSSIQRIICDNVTVARKVKEFLDAAMPRSKNIVELYVGKEGLFRDHGLEGEIEKIYSRRVELSSGGSLVIDQTEALVAIDVNSGRCRQHADAETTALKINLEAATEIARQLRLRDMGGVVIIDLIDMRDESNRRAVEKALKDAIKHDRAKTKVLRISSFGIVEMTRQRVRPSLKHSIYRTCKYCEGTGLIKSEETQALMIMQCLQRATAHQDVVQISVVVTPEVEHNLSNYHRQQISMLEGSSGKTISISAEPSLPGDEVRIVCKNSRGRVVPYEHPPPSTPGKQKLETVDIDQFVEPAEPPRQGPQADKQAPSDKQVATAEKQAPVAGEAEKEQAKFQGEAKKPRRRGRRGGRRHRRKKNQPAGEAAKQNESTGQQTQS